jgi:hypothetical protein
MPMVNRVERDDDPAKRDPPPQDKTGKLNRSQGKV